MSVRFGGSISDITVGFGSYVKQPGATFKVFYDKGITPAVLFDPNSLPPNAAINNIVTSGPTGYFEFDAPDGTTVLYTSDGAGGWVKIYPAGGGGGTGGSGLTPVYYGSDPNYPRPTTNNVVQWIGITPTFPANALNRDLISRTNGVPLEPAIPWSGRYSATLQNLTEGASVGTWYDTSGNSQNATQATSTAQPVFHAAAGSVPAYITFDGGDKLLAQAFSPARAQPGFMWAVVRAASVVTDSTIRNILGGGSASTGWHLRQTGDGTTAQWGMRGTAAFVGSSPQAPAVAGQWFFVAGLFNGAASRLIVNGRYQNAAGMGTATLDQFVIGAHQTSYFTGDIGDAAFMTGAVPTSDQIAQLVAVMSSRYGFTVLS